MDTLETEEFMLSVNQKDLWSLTKTNHSNFFNQFTIYLDGVLDKDQLKKSINSIVEKHETLSGKCILQKYSVFPTQVSDSGAILEFHDLDILEGIPFSSQINACLDYEYNLGENQPVRFCLAQVEDRKYALTVKVFSLWADTFSCAMFYEEFVNNYRGTIEESEEESADVIEYRNFSQWQNDLVLEKDEEVDFWETYDYFLRESILPFGKKSSEFIPEKVALTCLTNDKYTEFKNEANRLNTNLSDLLLCRFSCYLGSFTQNEFTIGYTPYRRNYEELNGTFGLVNKCLPIKFNKSGHKSAEEAISSLRNSIDEVNSWSDYYHLDRLNADRKPEEVFYNYCFECIHTDLSKPVSESELQFRIEYDYNVTDAFFIKLFCVDYGDRLQLDLYYDSDKLGTADVEVIKHQLLNSIHSDLNTVLDIPKLSSKEEEIISQFNITNFEGVNNKTIVGLFEQQVKEVPDNTAVIFGSKRLSYRELDKKSTQLAVLLREKYKVQPSEPVAVLMEQSHWLIISLLGILKSGAAYVPIDSSFPEERARFIMEDSKSKLVLSDDQTLAKMTALDIDALSVSNEELFAGESVHSLSQTYSGNDLAYILYTSGSTGTPKGCMISHGNLLNYIDWANSYYFSDSSYGNWGMITSISFDLTITSIFTPLTRGKKMWVGSGKSPIAEVLKECFSNPEIDTLKLTPSHLSMLKELGVTSTNIRRVICGGEQLNSEQVNALWDIHPDIKIFNEYGPTEATVGCIVKEIQPADEKILIGKPIANVKIDILQEDGSKSPIGIPGEICISGAGLSIGYINRPELTEEKFVINPFEERARMYKTGDHGRYLPDGNLEYIGRKDDQVKIRGFRIELGEIETALIGHTGIKEAAIVVVSNDNDEKKLVACVVLNDKLSLAEVRLYLEKILPFYMIPSNFIEFDAFPLTHNGKIDRKKLQEEGVLFDSRVEYIAPRNQKERDLVSVFETVLNKEGLGIKDDFFVLGGDSIKSIQVVSRLRQLNYSVNIQDIMMFPVIMSLADKMDVLTREVDQGTVKGEIPLGPIQRDFFEKPYLNKAHYNQAIYLNCAKAAEVVGLKKSLDYLVLHHDALRMVFNENNSGWSQYNLGENQSYTFVELDPSDEASFLSNCEQIQASFDLENGPLFKVVWQEATDQNRCLLIAHHLIIDGVSWRILLEDLATLQSQYTSGQPFKLPLKTDSFLVWQNQLEDYAKSHTLEKEEAYWKQIEKRSEGLTFPVEFEGGSNLMGDAEQQSFQINETLTKLVVSAKYETYHTTINDVLISALTRAIKDIFNQDQTLILMEGHGREPIDSDLDVSRTIGWFTSAFPVLIDAAHSSDAEHHLMDVKEVLHRVPNKGIGYGILKHITKKVKGLQPAITFNYLGDFGSNQESSVDSIFRISNQSIENTIASNTDRDALFDVSGVILQGKLNVSIAYSKYCYSYAKIEELVNSLERNLLEIVQDNVQKSKRVLTPVDLTYKGLSFDQLTELNKNDDVEDIYTLSPLQEGIYFHWMSNRESSTYFEQMSYRIAAATLDLGKITSVFSQLITRHSVLRTGFTSKYNGTLLQVVKKSVSENPEIIEALGISDKEAYIEKLKTKDRESGFDLAGAPLMRLKIVDFGDGEFEFIWSHHHILMDGWCMSVLINEFYQLLNASGEKVEDVLEPVLPYSNYINWLGKQEKSESLSYWKKYLNGYSENIELPFKLKNVEKTEYVHASEHLILEGDVYQGLVQLCNSLGITQNTFVQVVWGFLLAKYNNINDVVFGAVVSGRPEEIRGVESMIGLFINTIPVRVNYRGEVTPNELLKNVQNESISGLGNHYLSLSDVQAQSEPGMNLINHIVAYQNYAIQESETEVAFSSTSMDAFEQTNYDLNIVVVPKSDKLEISFNYNENVLNKELMPDVPAHFKRIAEQFVKDNDSPISSMNYLSGEEENVLLSDFNQTSVNRQPPITVLELFEKQAEKSPEAVGIVAEETIWTYKEINEQANQLAHYLKEKYEIQPDDRIAIHLADRTRIIVSMLAILKSGGAFLPIDPEYPQSRIDYMISDSQYKLVINEKELSTFQKEEANYSKSNLELKPGLKDLAYVIYTSGSTGHPKGVMIEHEALSNLSLWHQSRFNVVESDHASLYASIGFDASVWEIFPYLISGSALYAVPIEIRLDLNSLNDFFEKNNITISFLPTKIAESFFEVENNSLRYLLVGGDKLNFSKSKRYQLVNNYGPTESTVVATSITIEKDDSTLSIGKPIDNTQIYILGNDDSLVPVGVIGEICIGGNGLARGYLNNPELSEKVFVPNPFEEGKRMYRTGDMARWLSNGTIEYVSRKDDQVKIRGNRIELGEIESVLLEEEDISNAIVVTLENDQKDLELVAYIVSKTERTDAEYRAVLLKKLPSYMVPRYFVSLDQIPLTQNDKVDKKMLPNPKEWGKSTHTEYVAPSTEIEKRLVAIWEEILEQNKIGIKDDFFELGGHSLKAMTLIFKIEAEFEVKLKIEFILDFLTIEKLSDWIVANDWVMKSKDTQEENREEIEI